MRICLIGNNDVTELANTEIKLINTDNDVDIGDDAMDEYCDKITLAAGVTAKDKRLKDSLVASSSSHTENVQKIKKSTEKGDLKSYKFHFTLALSVNLFYFLIFLFFVIF